MRKFLATALAAVTFGGAVAASATPAAAASYRHHHRHHHGGGGDVAAAAVIAGIAGLALGAAVADNDRGGRYYGGYSRYSYDPRYDRYYGGYGGYGYGHYRVCTTRDRVWDPYIGRRVTIERRYPC
jgi:hypothetical protein